MPNTFTRAAAPRGIAQDSGNTRAESAQPAAKPQSGSGMRQSPTDKMLERAEKVAQHHGIKLTEDVRTQFDACREFLDEHTMPPSEKQINFAETLSAELNIDIPDAALKSDAEMRKFLDYALPLRNQPN